MRQRMPACGPVTLSEYTKLHGQTELARRLGVSQGMVWQWVSGRRPVAAHRCAAIEAATGGAVRKELLRPDVYPSTSQEAAA